MRSTGGSARGGWASSATSGSCTTARRQACFPPRARMVRSEAVDALLYGCATWTPLKGHYAKLHTTHHSMLLRILGAWYRSPNKRILSYKDSLERTECESIETNRARGGCCGRGPCSAWVTTGYPRGSCRESSRTRKNVGRGGTMDCVADDLRLFGITGDWSTAALDPGTWYSAVHEGSCRFMAAWVKEEENASNQR